MIRPFCIMLWYWYLLYYGMLSHIMSQYLCLFSLILQGLHKEGECRQLEFWARKGENIRDLFRATPKSWNSTEVIFGNYKKYWVKKILEGAHTLSTRVGARPLPRGPPGGPPVPIFCYMKSFTLEKIISKLVGRDSAATRRNQSRAPAELFCRGNIPPGGGNHRHHHH